MRLFSISISAWRIINDQPEVVLQNVVGLLVGETDVDGDTRQHAHDTFPESDGWQGHQFVATEIPQGMDFGPFRLTWQTERLPDTEGAE